MRLGYKIGELDQRNVLIARNQSQPTHPIYLAKVVANHLESQLTGSIALYKGLGHTCLYF